VQLGGDAANLFSPPPLFALTYSRETVARSTGASIAEEGGSTYYPTSSQTALSFVSGYTGTIRKQYG